ncbi:hypothetical protein EXIGLDRAFT_727935 [Exidia glandulosa HHB12029]|uniref:Major royal jelly protein n=1 Tax=Exidia glandulosa HHB12029 TaxID=1314781 RepID=A0A165D538_EXIGL|nr:hypothetical protein EXIGLDRAFT_727935 [Exidia glandulosa HHB12029]
MKRAASLLLLCSTVLALGNPGRVTDEPTVGAFEQLKVEHLYFDNAPTGVTVSASGRMFSNFPRPATFTLGEVVNGTHKVAFPSAKINNPPSFVNDTNPMFASNYLNFLLSLQQVLVDPLDRLWALDTGRPTVNGSMLLNSGGAKLLCFDLKTNSSTPLLSITFPPTVAYPETFLNDLRLDLRANVTKSGKGIVYIADSSTQGRAGIIVADLGTGQSWRHLDMHPSTLPEEGFRSAYDGVPLQPISPTGPFAGVYSQLTLGADGIAISPDGEWLYYTPLASRTLYRVRAALLRVPSSGPGSTPTAALQARAGVEVVARTPSHANGLEQDAAGKIYLTAPEENAIYTLDTGGLMDVIVRDPRIQWPDTAFLTKDKLWFTVNQLWLQPAYQNGTDKRMKPFAVLSVPIKASPVLLH